MTTLEENRIYWSSRAPGYSEVNQAELQSPQHEKWMQALRDELSGNFPERLPESLSILDVGTGPGFFPILLCELGYRVTAVDFSVDMLEAAKRNAGTLAGRIRYMEMNAEALAFPDGTFDAVVSRNLTWNLPHPEQAYAEWVRVLKPGGLLLNFDANWYTYLFDEAAQAAYVRDRLNSAELGIWDQNVERPGEDFDVMEDIALTLPLSGIRRPGWDLRILAELGCRAEADPEVWREVWSEEEKISFASTPLFLIRAVAG